MVHDIPFNPFKGMRLNLSSEYQPGMSLLAEHRLDIAHSYLSESENQWLAGVDTHESITRPTSSKERKHIQREVAHLTKALKDLGDTDPDGTKFDDELRQSLGRSVDLSNLLANENFNHAAYALRGAILSEIYFQYEHGTTEEVSAVIGAGIFLFMRFEEYLSARYFP